MKIISGQLVDLIDPFPAKEIPRLQSWIHCYHSLVSDDSTPKDDQSIIGILCQQLSQPGARTWGVIDKTNITNAWHEAPLVGCIGAIPSNQWNYYIHVLSSRASWGHGFMDEAVQLMEDEMFSDSSVLRLSGLIKDRNRAVKSLCFRMGWKLEVRFDDFILDRGEPGRMVHFGLTRTDWQGQKQEEEKTPSISDPAPSIPEESSPSVLHTEE